MAATTDTTSRTSGREPSNSPAPSQELIRPTSRRDQAGFGGALLLLTAAAGGQAKAADELDGALIAFASEYARLQDEYCVVCSGIDELPDGGPEKEGREARLAAISDRQEELCGLLCGMRPSTPEGLRAKAHAALCRMADGGTDATKPISRDNYLPWSLVNDLLARA